MILSKNFNDWVKDSTGTVTVSNNGERVTLNATSSTYSIVRHSFFAKKGDSVKVTVYARLWGASTDNAQLRIDNYNDSGVRSFISSTPIDSYSWKKYTLNLALTDSTSYGDIFSIGLGFPTAASGGVEFINPSVELNSQVQEEQDRVLLLGRIAFDVAGDPFLKSANHINVESVSWDAGSAEIRIYLRDKFNFPVDANGINDITEPHVWATVHRSTLAGEPLWLTYCFYVKSGGYLRMKFSDAAGAFVSDKTKHIPFQISFKMTT